MIVGEGGRDGTTMTEMIEDVEDLVLGTIEMITPDRVLLALTEIQGNIEDVDRPRRMRTRTGRRRPNSPTNNL